MKCTEGVRGGLIVEIGVLLWPSSWFPSLPGILREMSVTGSRNNEKDVIEQLWQGICERVLGKGASR